VEKSGRDILKIRRIVYFVERVRVTIKLEASVLRNDGLIRSRWGVCGFVDATLRMHGRFQQGCALSTSRAFGGSNMVSTLNL
jgi:hypothetical protein